MRRIAMKWAAVIVGVLPIAFLGAVGIAAMVLPARTQPRLDWVRLIDVESLPSDGTPEFVPVVVPHHDGWIRHPDRLVDLMIVRRTTDDGVCALDPRHHLGALVEYDAGERRFRSCCFAVAFDLDGKVIPGQFSHVHADLRTAETTIKDGAVFVRYDEAWSK